MHSDYRSQVDEDFYFQKRLGACLLLGGLATTAATLPMRYVLDGQGAHVMGKYANKVLPIGALCAGILSGTGYGLAAWLTGVRVRTSLLWTIALLQFVAYGAAEYLQYEQRFHAAAPNATNHFFE